MHGYILITGSSGFVGSHLKKTLLKKNYSIREFNHSEGDIRNAGLKFKNISHVFHLTGMSFVPDSWKNPKAFYDTNVGGTLNVLEFCRQSGASLTFMSSFIYGMPEKNPVSETHPLNPSNPYAHSKYIAENFCRYYQENFNVNVIIIRPFNIYGKGQSEFFLIPMILQQLFKKSLARIEVMDLKPKRDYVYIHDLIEAMILLFENNKFDTYNIGSGKSISVEEVIKKIFAATGIRKEYRSKNKERKNEIPDVVADITKIKNAIHWKPKYSFEEGISDMLKNKNRK
ncbi:MAG TPA: NAD(P)-dependent oxidoreductase [Bacteroidia bacterium]|nr:NAD(P)-dependent oxidoreductase [Bacteroidia bacterium]